MRKEDHFPDVPHVRDDHRQPVGARRHVLEGLGLEARRKLSNAMESYCREVAVAGGATDADADITGQPIVAAVTAMRLSSF